MKQLLLILIVFILTGCVNNADNKTTNLEPKTPTNGYTSIINKKFTKDSSVNVLNPDRGFYTATALTTLRDWDGFSDARANGFSLVYAPIELFDYVTTPTLPTSLLNTIKTNLEQAKNAKVKLILRISYRNSMDSVDASRTIIDGHLTQLAPLLQEYKNIISIVQAGTIGAWGEWHSFTGDYAKDNVNYKDNRRAIITRLHNIFPNKFIQIRTPMHKEFLYGGSKDYADESNSAMITQASVKSNNIISKIAHHNDCFVSSYTDEGTYPSDNIEYWKNYVQNDSQYSPTGGETCALKSGEEGLLSSCANIIQELKRFNYAFLNSDYNPKVIQKLKDEGCYTTIQENLGYRIVANSLNINSSDNNLSIDLSLSNKGYAAAYVPTKMQLMLKNDSHSYIFPFEDFDLRKLLPERTKTFNFIMNKQNVETGSYCLYMKISNEIDSIKLSNANLWDTSINANKLACSIVL